MDHAEDVAFSDRCIRSHHKVWSAESIEVCGVIGTVERHVEQFAQEFRRTRRVDLICHVCCFGCRHVMRLRAHAANAIRDQRHFLDGTSHHEAFKAAQFGNLEIRVGDVALLIKEDLDLAVPLQACDGVNGYSLGHGCSNP